MGMPQVPVCLLLSRGGCQPTGYGNDFVSKLQKAREYAWEHVRQNTQMFQTD